MVMIKCKITLMSAWNLFESVPLAYMQCERNQMRNFNYWMHKVDITLYTICWIYSFSKHFMPPSLHYWIMMLTSLLKLLSTSFKLLKCNSKSIERFICIYIHLFYNLCPIPWCNWQMLSHEGHTVDSFYKGKSLARQKMCLKGILCKIFQTFFHL